MPPRRTTRYHLRALALPLLMAGCGAATVHESVSVPPPVPNDSALALLTFDSAWSRIASTHYDSTYRGIDWKGVHVELRPRAATARTLEELRTVIGDMLARLGESHYGLIPGDIAGAVDDPASDDALAAGTGDIGMEVRLVGDELLVWRLHPGRAADRAHIGTGWALTRVRDRELAPRIAALNALPQQQRRTALTKLLYRVNAELTAAPGSALQVTLRDERGKVVAHTLVTEQSPGQIVRFGNLPATLVTWHHERAGTADRCAGVIRFNTWLLQPLAGEIDRAVDTMRDCAGIIIDLRGNPGGVAGMVMGVAGHFLTDTLALGFMKTRTTELRFKANPRRARADGSSVEPFAGRLAIIVDEMSASTSEFFAGGMQGVGRARVFGTPSAGQALPAAMLRLPNGDVLMHVIADFTGPGGVRIEGRGVIPDTIVAPTRADLLEGRDAPLHAAINWITGARAGS